MFIDEQPTIIVQPALGPLPAYEALATGALESDVLPPSCPAPDQLDRQQLLALHTLRRELPNRPGAQDDVSCLSADERRRLAWLKWMIETHHISEEI